MPLQLRADFFGGGSFLHGLAVLHRWPRPVPSLLAVSSCMVGGGFRFCFRRLAVLCRAGRGPSMAAGCPSWLPSAGIRAAASSRWRDSWSRFSPAVPAVFARPLRWSFLCPVLLSPARPAGSSLLAADGRAFSCSLSRSVAGRCPVLVRPRFRSCSSSVPLRLRRRFRSCLFAVFSGCPSPISASSAGFGSSLAGSRLVFLRVF